MLIFPFRKFGDTVYVFTWWYFVNVCASTSLTPFINYMVKIYQKQVYEELNRENNDIDVYIL